MQPMPLQMDPAMQAQLREMEMNFMDRNHQEKSRGTGKKSGKMMFQTEGDPLGQD